MPASMMMPPAGSMFSVSGTSKAIVAAGPSPGRMPTRVPKKQPTKHQNKFVGCSATANPCARPAMRSISEPEHADRQRDAESERKCQVKRARGEDSGQRGFAERSSENE